MFFAMLIFMSYNVFFCMALISGIGLGYFAFGGTRNHTYGLGRDNLDNDGLRGRLAWGGHDEIMMIYPVNKNGGIDLNNKKTGWVFSIKTMIIWWFTNE